ncbi:hypothetical protein GUITHDRAFT_46771, partial [Guillardia theta CCMP2712]
VKLFVLSDVHVDYNPNMQWLEGLRSHKEDGCVSILILAGDVASNLEKLERCFTTLREKFDEVVYIPGNHEFWINQGHESRSLVNSLDKLEQILEVCRQQGVRANPCLVSLEGPDSRGDRRRSDLLLLPLFSWYHASWDKEPELPPSAYESIKIKGLPAFEERWADFRYCKWPEVPDQGLADMFAKLNEPWVEMFATVKSKRESIKVITLSHFVPRQELVPEKRFLITSELPKVVGSDLIERQLRQVKSDLH